MHFVPVWAWLACAGAAGAVIVEWVLWYKLSSVLVPSLLLPLTPAKPLPRVQDPRKLDDFAGNGFTVSWRYHREARAILFRRRMSMGRKAYVTAAVCFGRDGTPSVRWAPSPLVMYPLLPLLFLPIAFFEGGAQNPLVMVAMFLAVTLFVGGINTIGAWLFLKNTGLPELQQQLEGWLR